MTRRLLVLFDGSSAASAALDHAVTLAHATGAPVVGLHAIEPPPSGLTVDAGLGLEPGSAMIGAATLSPEIVAQRRADGERALQELTLRCRRAGVASQTLSHDGPLLEVVRAHMRPDDLVAVGRAGRFARGGVGSFTRALIMHAPCPVLVAKPPVAPIRRLIVAFDGVPASCAALRAADRLGEQTGFPLTVLALGGRGAEPGDLEERARVMLSPKAAMAASIVQVQAQRRIEEPLLIEHMAGKDQTALLVMGAYADSPLVDLFFGSVTRHVLDHLTGPVLLIHG